MVDVEEFWADLPKFTKLYVLGIIATAAMVTLQIVSPYAVIVQPPEAPLAHFYKPF